MTSPFRFGAMLRRTIIAAVAVLPSAGAVEAQKQGGSISVGLELDIAGFDPLKVGVFDTSANMAAALLFDTLTNLDDKGNAQPKLALSWSHSDDYKRWTFKLRPGVKFHDGTAFDAKALKFNFDRQKDPKNKCRCAFYIANIKELEAADELTAVYTLTDPAVNFPEILTIPSANNVVQSPAAIQAQGGRLQSQSRRHRPVRAEILDRGRSHGAGTQSQLLAQGPALPRPCGDASAAGLAGTLCQLGGR